VEATRRNPLVAFILSAVAPGLGQIYNGQGKKGVFLYFLPWALWATTLPLIIWMPHPSVFITFFVIFFGAYIYICADAVITARRLRYDLYIRRYNRWYVYLLLLILSFLVLEPISTTFLFDTYRIPAGSMKPTLLSGDYLIADKLTYHFKTPARGDIVVFKYPRDEKKDWLKRIIGLPDEKIEIRDYLVYVNGVPLKEDYVVDNTGVRHSGDLRNYGPLTIPEGRFFVLGDNRDESYDSRHWGFLDQRKIHAKARTIYWSWDRKAFRVRWQRIGMPISSLSGVIP
jgi:signal peptidase I